MSPITIIIPIYCATDASLIWLRECMVSVVREDVAISVWDDGSPLEQQVRSICNDFDVHYAGDGVNRGPSYARNRAVGLANTDLIFPLDCDDYLCEGSIHSMYTFWLDKGGNTPVFPDLKLVFEDTVKKPRIHRLIDWSCDSQRNTLGIAPVCVLHSKQQWQSIGGWDENMCPTDLYEDSEYNARLFARYCAYNLHEPLVVYRQHDNSRLRVYRLRNRDRSISTMMDRIRKVTDMSGCCGGNKMKGSIYNGGTGVVSSAADLPEQDPTNSGKVLVKYVGGRGRGMHTYKGPNTGTAYRVTHGAYLYVDPADARENTEASWTSLIREHRAIQTQKTEIPSEVTDTAPVAEVSSTQRQPRRGVKVARKPVK